MAFENFKDQKSIMRRSDLSATEKWVAVVALSFRNAQDGRCDPPIESDDQNADTLCRLSGYTRPCVKKALDSLESKGVIERIKKTARPSQINFVGITRNDVTRNEVTRNEVTGYPKRGYGLPVTTLRQTDKEQISTDKDSFSSLHTSEAQTPDHNSSKSSSKTKNDARGTRFDLESLPDEWRKECERIQPKVDPAKVFEDFHDWWVAVPGAKGRKSDWLATWRNWCRRLSERDLQRLALRRTPFSVRPQVRYEQPEVKDNPFRVKKPSPPKVDQEEIDALEFFGEAFK